MVVALTREPVQEETTVAGQPPSVYRPGSYGPYPAVVVVNGMVPQGRALPAVQRLASGLARTGYLVAVPDLPGLTTDTLTANTPDALVAVVGQMGRPDVRSGRAGLIGVSTGGTLAMLTTEDPVPTRQVGVVATVAPYTDIVIVLAIATTAHYPYGGELVPFRAAPLLAHVAARSAVAILEPGPDRDRLLDRLPTATRHAADPLAALRRQRPADLGQPARAVLALLVNTDPARVLPLYEALPASLRRQLERLSPVAGAERLVAPVELVTGPQDTSFPTSEAYQLKRVARTAWSP